MEFLSIFQNNYPGFNNFCNNVLKPAFGADKFTERNRTDACWLTESDKDTIKSIHLLGEFALTDGDRLQCFDITLCSAVILSRCKVKIQQAVRRLLADFSSAIIVFHYPDNEGVWRISFVSKGENNHDSTSAKRYTYLLGPNEHCRTVSERFSLLAKTKGLRSLKAIKTTFSVETLTKDFYNELFSWYQWALSDNGGFKPITFPNDTSTDTDDRKIEEHIIRLITRLIFVWFIKQKGLVPNTIFSVDSLSQILKNFDPNSTDQGNYYNAILQNLFFATLNKAIPERAFASDSTNKEDGKEHYGVKSLFRNPKGDTWFKVPNEEIVALFSEVPFLNGGLFECLDKEVDARGKIMYFDGFSREAGRQRRAFIPNCLFFDQQKGIIPLLNKYNFTIEENTPSDVEVALDPELLGKVFENLLGAYNPETKESARKQSGSFYTPREIVSYMVDESLIAHIGTKCPNVSEVQLRLLFQSEAHPVNFDNTTRDAIIRELKSAKILDPACGSGAFPMGVLNRMVDLLQKLGDQEANTPYLQKLHLIENCIYGVDIQTIAVQISKLRFFISLVCEQTPNANAAGNYGITPLPNLETKFVAANTLIGLEKDFSNKLDLGYPVIRELKESLWKVRSQHFSAGNVTQKHELRKQDEKLRKEIEKQLVSITTQPDPAKIDRLLLELEALQAEKEKYKGECWVSLTPPEARQMSIFEYPQKAEQQNLKIDTNKEERNRIEKFIKATQKELEKETSKTNQPGFESEAAQLAAWNPYDQNTSSTFFDPEWMFDVKDGFDVVIGNPPYGVSIVGDYRKKIINFLGKVPDFEIYYYFIEIANKLSRLNGINSYIIPNTFLFNVFASEYRKRLFDNWSLDLIIDCTAFKLFEGATVSNVIYIFRKNDSCNRLGYKRTKDIKNISELLLTKTDYLNKNYVIKNNKNWALLFKLDKETLECVEKISAHPHLDKFFDVSQGYIPYRKSDLIKLYGTEKGKSIVKNREWHNTKKITAEYKQEIWGENLNKYGYSKPMSFIWYGKHLATYIDLKYFNQKRVLVREITNPSIIATIVEEELVNDPQIISIIPKLDNSLEYLWSILNSKLATFYHFNSSPKATKGAFPKILVTDINQFPLPPISIEDLLKFKNLIKNILSTKKIDPQADTLQWEAEIDARVFYLYGLTECEVKLVLDSLPSLSEEERIGILSQWHQLNK